ncbi:MAG: hypothetical protein ACRCVT_09425 [Leadbetterella sp.]
MAAAAVGFESVAELAQRYFDAFLIGLRSFFAKQYYVSKSNTDFGFKQKFQ